MPRILVTPRSVTAHGHPALKRLEACGYDVILGPAGRQPTESELLSLLPGCVGYLAGVEPVSARVLASATPTLRVMSRNGTGTDRIDLVTANLLGVEILTAAGANARGVAELTLGLLLALARGIVAGDASIKKGGWDRSLGFELEGRTLGVLGYGNVGRRVAALARGFGMRVIAHDPALPAPRTPIATVGTGVPTGGPEPASAADATAAETPTVALAASAGEVIRSADVLTLHCPPTSDRRPLLDRPALALMPRGSYLINTARFDLIDEAAVLDALEDGQLAGAALDVFHQEPPTGSVLAAHPRVIATPHIGGFTRESVDRAMESAVTNLIAALGSQP